MERQTPQVGAGARTRPHEQAEARRLRWANRARAERIREAQLAVVERQITRRRDRIENYAPDWTGPYADYLDRLKTREPFGGTMTGAWHRQQGRNYPFFQNEQELALLRAPSRFLCTTNSYAIGLLEGLTSYVVGTGYTYRAAAKGPDVAAQLPPGLLESCQLAIDEHHRRNDWFGGEQPSLEEELFGRSCEDGEFVLVHFRQTDGTVEVRTAEPDQLTMPPGHDAREWSFGVNTDPRDTQKPLAYWLQWGTSPSEGEEYGPDEIVHVRRNVRRDVKRGMPDFCFDTADALRLAGVLRENLTEGAAIQAAIVGVRQHEAAGQSEVQRFVDADAEWNEVGPTGQQQPVRRQRVGFEDIPKGMGYVTGPGANNAPAHIAVMEACLRGGGVRWNAPEWLTTGYAAGTNYASSLTSESPFVGTVLRRQRTYREAFRRSAEVALLWAAECGRVRDAHGNLWRPAALAKVVEILVEAPNPVTRDGLKDAQTAQIEIPLGVDSRQQYTQRQGRDWQKVDSDNQDYLQEHGSPGAALPLPGDDDPDPGAQAPAPRPESLLETRDGDGHDHDKNGKFTGSGSGASGAGGRPHREHGTKSAESFDRGVNAVHRRVQGGEEHGAADSVGGARYDADRHAEQFVSRVKAGAAAAWKETAAAVVAKHGDTPAVRELLAAKLEEVKSHAEDVAAAAVARAGQPFNGEGRADRDSARADLHHTIGRLHDAVESAPAFVERYLDNTKRQHEVGEALHLAKRLTAKGGEPRGADARTLARLQDAGRWATVKRGGDGAWEIHTPAHAADGSHLRPTAEGGMQLHDTATGRPTSPSEIRAKKAARTESLALLETKDSSGHEHAADGRFGSGGTHAGGAEHGKRPAVEAPKKGVFGAIRSAGSYALDTKVGRGLLAVEHRLSIVAHKTRDIAVEAGKRRGLTPHQTDRLHKALAIGDFAGGWVAGGVTTAVAGPIAGKAVSLTLPSVSAVYLAYSAARNPRATWAAARQVVGASFTRGTAVRESDETYDPVARLADLFAGCDGEEAEFRLAVFYAATQAGAKPEAAIRLAASAELPAEMDEHPSDEALGLDEPQ